MDSREDRGDSREPGDPERAALAPTIDAVAGRSAVDAVCAVARTIWFEHYPGIISWAQVHYMIERGYRPEVVEAEIERGVRWDQVVDGGRSLGFIAYRQREDCVWVDKIYLLVQARRRGIARGCLERADRFARELGCVSLRLTVNKRNLGSIAAYLGLGFSFEAALVKDIGCGFVMDDYVMRRHVI